jgi:hypothetical protein
MSPKPISPDIIGGNEIFLLYGKPKTGKTFTALTIPPPIYFMSVGVANEAKVYYSKAFQKKYGSRLKPEDLQIDVGTTSQEVKDLAEEAIEKDASGKGFQFRSIVIDNATPLIDLQLDVAMEMSYTLKLEANRGTDKTALSKLKEYGAVVPQQGDWGIAQGIMRRFISELLAVEKHVVFIAHEYELKVAGPQQTQTLIGVEPWFIGRDRNSIGNRFDNVWRLTREGNDVYVARTDAGISPRGGYTILAGSRIGGVVPRDFEDPDLSKAIQMFQEHAMKQQTP